MVLTIFLHRIDGLLLEYDMIIFLSGIFRIFLKSSKFIGFAHIPSQNRHFTHQIWSKFPIWKFYPVSGFFSGFFCIFRIFAFFLQILIYLFEIKVYSAHEVGLKYLSLVHKKDCSIKTIYWIQRLQFRI